MSVLQHCIGRFCTLRLVLTEYGESFTWLNYTGLGTFDDPVQLSMLVNCLWSLRHTSMAGPQWSQAGWGNLTSSTLQRGQALERHTLNCSSAKFAKWCICAGSSRGGGAREQWQWHSLSVSSFVAVGKHKALWKRSSRGASIFLDGEW